MKFTYFLTSYLRDPAIGGKRHFDDVIAQAVAADRLGFDALALPEHHLINVLLMPSPLQVAVKIAGLTRAVEIVTAVALLIMFAAIKSATNYHGLAYLIVAHTAFCIPFAYLPIRARLEGMDLSLETAAADLYATPWMTFRRVTLPLLWPGILAGAMLAFVISLDDVVITEFVKSAGQDTLPTYMLGQLRRAITPEVNAISSVLLAVSVAMVTIFFFLNRKMG